MEAYWESSRGGAEGVEKGRNKERQEAIYIYLLWKSQRTSVGLKPQVFERREIGEHR